MKFFLPKQNWQRYACGSICSFQAAWKAIFFSTMGKSFMTKSYILKNLKYSRFCKSRFLITLIWNYFIFGITQTCNSHFRSQPPQNTSEENTILRTFRFLYKCQSLQLWYTGLYLTQYSTLLINKLHAVSLQNKDSSYYLEWQSFLNLLLAINTSNTD